MYILICLILNLHLLFIHFQLNFHSESGLYQTFSFRQFRQVQEESGEGEGNLMQMHQAKRDVQLG